MQPQSVMGTSKITAFQFPWLFLVERMAVMTSKLFAWQSWNCKIFTWYIMSYFSFIAFKTFLIIIGFPQCGCIVPGCVCFFLMYQTWQFGETFSH